MTNQEKMLNLVLSDTDLIKYYKLDTCEFYSIEDALNSDKTIIVAIATIIKQLNGSDSSSKQKEVYKQVFNHLNNNAL